MTPLTPLVLAVTEQRTDLEHFNEMIGDWPVQLFLVLLYIGLAILTFTRLSRDVGRDRRWRALVVALGVFVTLEFLLGESVLGAVVWPFWVKVPLFLWLFAMSIYYIMRAMTRVRPGAADPAAQARGMELENVLVEAEAERRRPQTGAR